MVKIAQDMDLTFSQCSQKGLFEGSDFIAKIG